MEFVTRKVSNGVGRIKLGLQDNLTLGNLESSQDRGYDRDFCEAMWLMLQQQEPDDYVIATGESHTIGELLEHSFAAAGISEWRHLVISDPRFNRPAEVEILTSDPSKARQELGWKPSVGFPDLVRMMVEHDLTQESAGKRP